MWLELEAQAELAEKAPSPATLSEDPARAARHMAAASTILDLFSWLTPM
jgi:hypothetical protein